MSPESPQAEKDPIVSRAETALKRIDENTSDKDLLDARGRLEEDLKKLKEDQEEARDGTADGEKKWLSLDDQIKDLDKELTKINLRLESKNIKKNKRTDRVLDDVRVRGAQLERKANRIDRHDDNKDQKRDELVAESERLDKIIRNPATPDEERKASVEARGKVLETLESMEKSDREEEARERAKEILEFEEKERANADDNLKKGLEDNAASDGTPSAEGPAETTLGFGNRMAAAAEDLARDIANNPPERGNIASILGSGWKTFALRVTLMMSNKELEWHNRFDEGQKTILKRVVGLTIDPPKEGERFSQLKWGPVDKTYQAPGGGSIRVMRQFFEDKDWLDRFDALKVKTEDSPGTTLAELKTQAEVEAQRNPPETELLVFVEKMEEEGARPDVNVREWLEANSYKLSPPDSSSEEGTESGASTEKTAEKAAEEKKPLLDYDALTALIKEKKFTPDTPVHELLAPALLELNPWIKDRLVNEDPIALAKVLAQENDEALVASLFSLAQELDPRYPMPPSEQLTATIDSDDGKKVSEQFYGALLALNHSLKETSKTFLEQQLNSTKEETKSTKVRVCLDELNKDK